MDKAVHHKLMNVKRIVIVSATKIMIYCINNYTCQIFQKFTIQKDRQNLAEFNNNEKNIFKYFEIMNEIQTEKRTKKVTETSIDYFYFASEFRIHCKCFKFQLSTAIFYIYQIIKYVYFCRRIF